MPQYFMHLHECGTVVEDEDGVDCTNDDTARFAAIQAARDIMRGEVKAGRLCLSCCIVITTDDGREAGRVLFKEAIMVTG